MNAEPSNWSVVVVGGWNRAILTPQGVGEHIFKLANPGEVLELEVSVNQSMPCRIKYDGMIVTVPSGKLVIEPVNSAFTEIEKAMRYALNAISALPKTPIGAAGINVRFLVNSPSDEILGLLRSRLDDSLTNDGIRILSSAAHRALDFRAGCLNLKLAVSESSDVSIDFNYHRESVDQSDLREWLSIPVKEISEHTNSVLRALGIPSSDE